MNATLAGWQAWVQTLGWTLVHFIWQAAVVAVAFAAVRALLPRSRCRARYANGLVALVALVAWPVSTFIALRPQAVMDAVQPVGSVATTSLVQFTTAAQSGLGAVIEQGLPWLVLLWAIGVLGVSGRTIWQWNRLTRVARRWAVSNPDLDAMLLGLRRRLGLLRRIRLLVSDRIHTPMLIGWLKPVILLPTSVALGFPREQVELILAHELGHLRRYDHLVNLAQAVLETVLFYHPVVHWISREVRNERELCCDELVLRMTRGEPRAYARALAALEEMRQDELPMVLAANGGDLLERVRRIVGVPAPRMLLAETQRPTRWLFLAAAMCLIVVMAARIERTGDAAFLAPGVAVNWLMQPELRTLPLAALTLPFDRPRLHLATPAPSVLDATASAIDSRATNSQERSAALAPAVVASVAVGTSQDQARAAQVAPIASVPIARATTPQTAAVDSSKTTLTPRVSAKTETLDVVRKPVAIRVVQPTFPVFARRESGRVEANFAIAADGSVTDIRFTGGGSDAFSEAAERALRQWRFDPASLPGDRSMRYSQDFVFAPSNRGSGRECVQVTGSLICRDPADPTSVTSGTTAAFAR